ncbi:hypothetical protein GCM10020358_60540 [Amorphoplanes nipponensis]|uniref:STAS domain-containing protein n=1 Tax=Actinoplanes nipponensis TaxID=135950 RepID=UPI0031ECC16A
MTVDAVAADAGVHLICDGCGRVAAASGCGLHDAHVVYVAVGEIGWTGPAFARGPHRCPGCETRGPGHGRRRRQRRTNPTGRVSWQLTRAVCLVRAVGDLDVEIVGDLRAALDTALTEHAVVIVDLTRAASIDPIATGAVLRARQSARRFGTDLLLVASSAIAAGGLAQHAPGRDDTHLRHRPTGHVRGARLAGAPDPRAGSGRAGPLMRGPAARICTPRRPLWLAWRLFASHPAGHPIVPARPRSRLPRR